MNVRIVIRMGNAETVGNWKGEFRMRDINREWVGMARPYCERLKIGCCVGR